MLLALFFPEGMFFSALNQLAEATSLVAKASQQLNVRQNDVEVRSITVLVVFKFRFHVLNEFVSIRKCSP